MMKRNIRLSLLALLLCLPLLLSGCYEQLNPLMKNEATDVPGLNEELHAAVADDGNVTHIQGDALFPLSGRADACGGKPRAHRAP